MSIMIRPDDMLDRRVPIRPVIDLLDALEYKRYRKHDGIRPSVLEALPRVLISKGMTRDAAMRVVRQLQA